MPACGDLCETPIFPLPPLCGGRGDFAWDYWGASGLGAVRGEIPAASAGMTGMGFVRQPPLTRRLVDLSGQDEIEVGDAAGVVGVEADLDAVVDV